MVAWLDRLVGRRRQPEATPARQASGSMACFSTGQLPALPNDQQFSVWEKLADDPRAREIRAYWEAKWETFCEPAEWGGPPARGELLPFWQPAGMVDPEGARNWKAQAYRLALGVELVAHMEPIVDEDKMRVGFCVRSEELAHLIAESIVRENIGAIVTRAHPGMEQDEACDILLACSPAATDDEVKCAVVAATKTAHVFFCAAPLAAMSGQ